MDEENEDPECGTMEDMLAGCRRSEADVASGRVVPVEDVIRRLRETTARMKARRQDAATTEPH